MFLNSLNTEQKTLFIELAIKAAESNGVVELEEKNMLKCFAIEMGMAPVYYTDRDVKSIIDDIREISAAKELKIILFEILGIMVSDTVFDDKDKIFVKYIVKKWNIDPSLVDKMVGLLVDYAKIYQNIVETVL